MTACPEAHSAWLRGRSLTKAASSRFLSAATRAWSTPDPSTRGSLGPCGSELVGGRDHLGDRDLRWRRISPDPADERLELRVAEELLELLRGLPLVDDQDEAVAYAKPVVDRPDILSPIPDVLEFASTL